MDSGLALKRGITFPWMFGPRLDILFYFAPIAVALYTFSLTHAPEIARSIFWATVVSSGFGAGPFHGGPTWFVYFDRRNIDYYGSSPARALTYFVLPPAILVASVVGMIYLPHLTNAVYIFWTIQHLVQQNVGILLLYHNHGRGEAIVGRTLEKATLYSSTVCCTLTMVASLDFEGLGGIPGLSMLVAAALAVTLAGCAVYVAELFRQVASGRSLNMPAFLFWIVSVGFFLPLALLPPLFARSAYQCLLIPLVLHWFQYIGLNYVLVKRKYASDEVKNLPVGRPLALLSSVCVIMVVTVLTMNMVSLSDNGLALWHRKALVGAVFGLSLVHYYLDAFIWRFREAYQRESILPYLLAKPANG